MSYILTSPPLTKLKCKRVFVHRPRVFNDGFQAYQTKQMFSPGTEMINVNAFSVQICGSVPDSLLEQELTRNIGKWMVTNLTVRCKKINQNYSNYRIKSVTKNAPRTVYFIFFSLLTSSLVNNTLPVHSEKLIV